MARKPISGKEVFGFFDPNHMIEVVDRISGVGNPEDPEWNEIPDDDINDKVNESSITGGFFKRLLAWLANLFFVLLMAIPLGSSAQPDSLLIILSRQEYNAVMNVRMGNVAGHEEIPSPPLPGDVTKGVWDGVELVTSLVRMFTKEDSDSEAVVKAMEKKFDIWWEFYHKMEKKEVKSMTKSNQDAFDMSKSQDFRLLMDQLISLDINKD